MCTIVILLANNMVNCLYVQVVTSVERVELIIIVIICVELHPTVSSVCTNVPVSMFV